MTAGDRRIGGRYWFQTTSDGPDGDAVGLVEVVGWRPHRGAPEDGIYLVRNLATGAQAIACLFELSEWP